jgi:hypothetical protein
MLKLLEMREMFPILNAGKESGFAQGFLRWMRTRTIMTVSKDVLRKNREINNEMREKDRNEGEREYRDTIWIMGAAVSVLIFGANPLQYAR